MIDFFGGFSVLVERPWLTIVPGLFFFLLYRARRLRLTALTSSMWLAYGVYEYLVKRRVLCSGECNIRVDLLLLYPVLAIVSLAALARAAWSWWKEVSASRSS